MEQKLGGEFELLDVLGHGGMATVWRARHLPTGQPAAVKVIHSQRARGEAYQRAFRREVQSTARLEHPGIVRVYDYGTISKGVAQASASTAKLSAGSPFLAMEYVDGGTLRQAAARVSTWEQLREVLLLVLDALAFAHARDLVHRDLKPENILVAGELDDLRLADFGIAYPLDPVRQRIDADADGLVSAGTPAYIAPEQATGDWRSFGPWTDLYALGCMAYELICGHPPFQDDNVVRLVSKHVHAPVPPLQPRFAVPEGAERWLRGLLGKMPRQRFRSAPQAAGGLVELTPAASAVVETSASTAVEAAADTVLDSKTLPLLATCWGDTAPMVEAHTRAQGDVRPAQSPGTPSLAAGQLLPSDWRRPQVRADSASYMAGLGIFGLREVPFVGREPLRDRLWELMGDTIGRSRPRAAVLRGLAGAGKSRLAQWLTRRVRETDAATVLRVHHNRDEAPGAGLGRLLTNHFRLWGLSDAKAKARILVELRGLSAELGDAQLEHDAGNLVQLARPDSDLAHHADRRALMGSLQRWFEMSAANHPMLVWFDDVQWSTGGLELADSVLGAQREQPVMMLLTVRDDLISGAQARRLEGICAYEHAVEFDVGPMDDDDRRDLVNALLPVDDKLAAQVGERTGGHPLFAVHLLSSWIEAAKLERGPGGFQLRNGAEAVARDAADICRRRLEHLVASAPQPQRRARRIALEIAACLGDEPRRDDWAYACQLAGVEVDLDVLVTQMIDRNLARHTTNAWRFAHGQFREQLVEICAEAGRTRDHHDRCAQALERSGLAGSIERRYRHAIHLVEAHRFADALDPVLQAFNESRRAGHWVEAKRLLDIRRRVTAELGYSDRHPACVENDLEYGHMLLAEGRVDEAFEVAERVRPRMEKASREQVVDFETMAGNIELLSGEPAQALAHFDRAVEITAGLEDAIRLPRARALIWKGDALRLLGRLDESLQANLLAVAALEDVDSPGVFTDALLGAAYICKQLGRYDQADAHLDRAMQFWRTQPNPPAADLTDVWNVRGEVERVRGNFEVALEHYRRTRLLAERASARLTRAAIDVNIGITLVELQRWDEASETLLQAIDTLTDAEDTALASMARTVLGVCAAQKGDWSLWERYVRPGLVWLETHDVVELENAQYAELAADLAKRAGRHEAADLAGRVAAAQRAGLDSQTGRFGGAEIS